ncbi:dehydratase [Parapusillimonas sp. SGNA-6]|nr:dehydratase [Parapusillimonas sp. SGNA-6]
MRPLYYEDVEVGARFIVPGRSVTEADVLGFATVSGDLHPIHTDAAYAATTEFGQRIAHGPFGIAIAIGLFGRIPEFTTTAVAMLSVSEWKFRAPVFIGDTLRLEMIVAGKRLTTSGRGIIDRHMKLVKQDDTLVQEGNSELLIARQP